MDSDRASIRNRWSLLFVALGTFVFLMAPAAPAAPQPVPGDAYAITARADAWRADPEAAWHAANRAQGFGASFTDEGVRVAPLEAGEGSWRWGLSLVSYGYAGRERSVDPAALLADRNRIEYVRDDLIEWYVNEARGLKHGLTLEKGELPGGSPEGHEGDTSTLHVEFDITGALLPVMTGDGDAVEFILPGERFAALRYGGLKVTGAGGHDVPARLEVIAGGRSRAGVPGGAESAGRAAGAKEAAPKSRLRIVLDVAGAVFPLEVDPLLTTASWSSTETDYTTSVAWGDWDGDGDLDLAAGNHGEANRVYENSGGALSLAWSSTETDDTFSVAWGDWDGDGDLDLAVGNQAQANRVYENSGGALSLAWSSSETDETASVAWGDWDGDGDLDLAAGNYGQANRVYENSGGALSLAWSSTETDDTFSVAWGDWDGDGDLDLAAGNDGQANRVYENSGGALSLAWSSSETDSTLSVAWGDWDGDGDLDLAVGNYFAQANRVYENSGGALSLAWSSDETDDTVSVAWGDWDGDGDLDLAAGNVAGEPNRVYGNSGGALALVWSSSETDDTYSVAWGDWDGDGDLDLATGNWYQANRVYANSGGALALAWSSTETDWSWSVAWGDWDGDGDLDLVVGNVESGDESHVYENSGGALSLAWSFTEENGTASVAWGDWDGDGDLDLAAGAADGQIRVYENSGGALSLAWSSTELASAYSVAWGDWDGDGDLDLAVANSGHPNRVYENTGTWLDPNAAWSSSETDNTMSVAWGDWDGDGDLDLAVGNSPRLSGQANRVYENLGGGLDPNAAWSSSETDRTYSVAWGDWDGDGDLDLAAGNWRQANRVYENTGGALALAWSSGETDDTISVAWGDWDGDGDLDLAVGNEDQANRVYENTGGALSLAWSSTETDYTYGVAWGDWDGDGDLDLAVGNNVQPNRVYTNGRLTRPGGLPETPVHPVTLDRPGSTDSAFFFSSAECVPTPVSIPYTLFDGQSDRAWSIVPEYSLAGGGQWLPATEGTGGDGTSDLAASPGGTTHTFSWDCAADADLPASAVFRITVTHQAPDHAGYPVQQGSLSAVTPSFRIDMDGDSDGLGDACDNCPSGYNPGQLLAGLGDRVWLDDDGDGIQDAGEAGFAGVPVLLFDSAGTFLEFDSTDPNGVYAFTSACPDSVVQVVPPVGHSFTARDQGGDDALDSDVDPATGIAAITLTEGGTRTDVDAGLVVGCPGPDEPIYIYLTTLSTDGNDYPILHFMDSNQPGNVTGYNVYRSSDPVPPPSTWPVVASDVIDMDESTPNKQWVDTSGDVSPTGIWYYEVTAYDHVCLAEGPF